MDPADERMVERMFELEIDEAALDQWRRKENWLDAKEVLRDALKDGDQGQIEICSAAAR